MDTIINSALEEICAHGDSGVPLSKLWPKLLSSISSQGLKLCLNVKKVLWYKVLEIPGLKFVSNGVFYDSHADFIRSVEQSERICLNIIAGKHLCDSFIGIYDVDASDAKLSDNESRVLDCLAFLRGNGITQIDLRKKFKLKANEIGYILNKLESRGLIVRQSTLVRQKGMAGEGDLKNAPVSTNIVYLSRYAKNVGSQQRLEITDLVDDEITDIHVKDFLPPLQAICDKLEKAEGKEAECLHLLKGFSPKHFESKSRARGCGDLDTETAMEKVNRCHISEMLLELPIEHQIYGMIDAEGDRGLSTTEVLRVYYDKRQQRLPDMGELQTLERMKFSHSKTLGQIVNEEESPFLPTILQHTSGLEGYHVGNAAAEESELPEDDGLGHAFLAKCTLSGVKSARRGKFCWTDDADRQLVIEYARHRAALGAKFNRVDWGKLLNLPGPPDACRRRMALLRNSLQFRKSVMSLCNLLSQHYVEYLGKFRDKTLKHEGHQAMQCECFNHTSYEAMAFNNTEPWDNFDDADIKMALDHALLYKKSAKSETAKEVQPTFDNCSDVNTDERHVSYAPQSVLPVSDSQYVANFPGKTKDSDTPLSSNRIPQKYVKLKVGGVAVDERLYESVAVANAAELFKLIFLCSSKSPLVPTLLAETLRRYSEHDLLAAFNYLRDKKVLIGGNASSPFVLSPTFLHCICFSPFPINTGKRAAKLASWICEREKELIAEGVDLPTDLQCGDVFHLCALLSSEELSFGPRLPDEGVGEVEDSRLSKRKYDDRESPDGDRFKKLKTSMAGDGEICSRRAKGFPGIRLCLRRATITMDSLKEIDICTPTPSVEEHQTITTSHADYSSVSFDSDGHVNELLDSGGPYVADSSTKSPWEAMTTYVKHVYSYSSCLEQNSSLYPEIFRSVYSAIQMAGDQGLCMKDIAKVLTMQEKKLTEAVVEVLEAFGRVLKVNAYDSIRVVDSLYRSKYVLTPVGGIHQDATLSSYGDEEPFTYNRKDYKDELQTEISGSSDKVHKITILNLPKAVAEPSSEKQTINEAKGCLHTEASSSIRNQPEKSYELHSTSLHLRRPILPWLNGDGTTNEHVYKGLVRRVLGIMMQNPGIQEDDIIRQMHVLNPQSCRSLLNMMVLDNDVFVRKIPQTKPAEAPAILSSLLGSHFKRSQLVLKEHFFANPSSTNLL